MKRLKFDSPKRKAIRAELKADPARSDNMIAKLCGCTNKTVAAVRYEQDFPTPDIRQCADGIPRRRPHRRSTLSTWYSMRDAWNATDRLLNMLPKVRTENLSREQKEELKRAESVLKSLFSRF